MHSPRRSARGEYASTARYPRGRPRRPANWRHHPEVARGQPSLESLDLVPDRGRELELLRLYGAPQPFAKLAKRRRTLEKRRRQGLIPNSCMPGGPVDLAQQLSQALLEGSVAVHAPQSARVPELPQRGRAERAPGSIGLL